MAIHAEALGALHRVRLVTSSVGILSLPLVLTFFVSTALLRVPESSRAEIWRTYRAWTHFVVAATIACWWVFYDVRANSEAIAKFGLVWWLPPMLALGGNLIVCVAVDRAVFELRWTMRQVIWRVWWRLVGFVIPLLMLAVGFDAIFDGRIAGSWWIIAAGLIAKIGTGISRFADGLKLNTLKSGETRNRVLRLANRMGVQLHRVYLVPAGKGHLTNGYGMSNAIGLTDNLGKYLTKEEVNYVIAHELAHVKLGHGRKYLMLVSAIFASMVLLFFRLHSYAPAVRALLQFAVVLGPILALNFLSRRHEYAADAEAVQLTGDAEAAVRALIHLNRIHDGPIQCSVLTELIGTHPTLTRRLARIADAGEVRPERMTDILKSEALRTTPVNVNAPRAS